MDAYIAVLDEQQRQAEKGIRNPARIARAYQHAAASQCQIEASSRGKQDAAAAYHSTQRPDMVTRAAKAA